VFVRCSVPAVGATLRNHLHLRARGAVEVGGLVGCSDRELLNAVYGSGHDARRPTATGCAGDRGHRHVTVNDASARITRETGRIGILRAIHVAGVVTAIELKGVLILIRASHAAIGRDAWLKRDERTGVAAKARQSG